MAEPANDDAARLARRAARAAELQARYGHPRTRVIDDHMFAVGGGVWYPSTFRLQLFTAPGARPVAVVIQTCGEGMGLTNGRERYLAEIWRRHCPDETEPPLWIARQLRRGWDQFMLMNLPAGPEPHTITAAHIGHCTLTLDQIRAMVESDVDDDRGEGFVPRPPEPDAQTRFSTAWVALLPRPDPFRQDDCMPNGITPARRLARQLMPRFLPRRGPACCWYHEGNWRKVSRVAIKLLRRANRVGIDHDELYDYFEEQ
ncbi:hypothetical protein AGRA3207_007348 [Actinomadura graeca]|uniref:Uncharacterized protein n=1 Tax=Actinomadura graeca TaxID=2750812 RepID=A0ABX8R4N9_9ACTN|nr:hypothetical protein [Actinomadura graeca]QXJ25798.1 hypothetical protein AGRA3207_007348 [Actinomadura graeca]